MFTRRRDRLTTDYSERIPVVKRRISVLCTFLSNKPGLPKSRSPGRSTGRLNISGLRVIFSANCSFSPLHANMCLGSLARSRQGVITVRFTVTSESWMLNVERASCHPSGVWNLGVAPRFVKHFMDLCMQWLCRDTLHLYVFHVGALMNIYAYVTNRKIHTYKMCINVYPHVSVASLYTCCRKEQSVI
jgi:hypothetical protein